MPTLYEASSRALACLESVLHLDAGGLPFNRYLVEVEIPDDLRTAAEIANPATLAVGWDAEPAGHVDVDLGSVWAMERQSALLLVSPAIVPAEQNLQINLAHPSAAEVRALKVRRWLYEPRLPLGTKEQKLFLLLQKGPFRFPPEWPVPTKADLVSANSNEPNGNFPTI